VLYNPDTFPPGYVPNVSGYQFEARPDPASVPGEAPRALTVDLRWFRGRPMTPAEQDVFESKQALRDRHGTWNGVELCMFNGGGGGPEREFTIGGCSVYYDVRQTDGRWTVSYSWARDP
jgi:hypothetical protein